MPNIGIEGKLKPLIQNARIADASDVEFERTGTNTTVQAELENKPDTGANDLHNVRNVSGSTLNVGDMVFASGQNDVAGGISYINVTDARGQLASAEIPVGIMVKQVNNLTNVKQAMTNWGVVEITQSGLTLNFFDPIYIELTGSGAARSWQFTATDSDTTYLVGQVKEVINQSSGNYAALLDFSIPRAKDGEVRAASFSGRVLTLGRRGLPADITAVAPLATTSSDGAMSSGDKIKLDNLVLGATDVYNVRNVTGSTVAVGGLLTMAGGIETASGVEYIDVSAARGQLSNLEIPHGIAIKSLPNVTNTRGGMATRGAFNITQSGLSLSFLGNVYVTLTGSGASQRWEFTGTSGTGSFLVGQVHEVINQSLGNYYMWLDFGIARAPGTGGVDANKYSRYLKVFRSLPSGSLSNMVKFNYEASEKRITEVRVTLRRTGTTNRNVFVQLVSSGNPSIIYFRNTTAFSVTSTEEQTFTVPATAVAFPTSNFEMLVIAGTQAGTDIVCEGILLDEEYT